MTNQEKMAKEREILTKNLSFRQLKARSGWKLEDECKPLKTVDGVVEMSKQLNYHGGYFQQNRMIKDKQKSLQKALLYSYQSAFIKKWYSAEREGAIERALINPDKLKQDYDDKILSIGFEAEFKPGDIFEWVDTNTYWLIYLQQQTEIAYFRGNVRRCRYKISWKDGDEIKTTFAAVRGPVETKIESSVKHGFSLDLPNYSLHLLLPKNEDTIKQFKRYTKFYLSNTEEESAVCWRVEAVDSISTPGILEINALEYYANDDADDIENGIIDAFIAEPIDPNIEDEDSAFIVGETFIKPYITYEYKLDGTVWGEWEIVGKVPVELSQIDDYTVQLKWTIGTSGNFILKYNDQIQKTIVVESLF